MSVELVELWAGWSLTLPNPCQHTRNTDGSWSAWDTTHVVDLSIIEVGGHQGGGDMSPTEMLAPSSGREVNLDGAIARVSSDIEMTDTADGSKSVAWTRFTAGATNTVLIMSIGNTEPLDASWHESLWRSVRHSSPASRRFGFLSRR